MKIPTQPSQYLQAVQSVSAIAPTTLAKNGENELDPLYRPIEQTPVDASEHTFGLAANDSDSVELSDIARTSLDNINKLRSVLDERVRALFEKQGINEADEKEIDHSPAAVSRRIVDFSTGFFDIFLSQNSQLSEEQALDSFENIIRSAFKSGYGQAMKLLERARIPSSTLEVSRDTKSLVDEGFDKFFAEKREALRTS